MKYFLDFDGVIFDVVALKKKMMELGIDESTRSVDALETLLQKEGKTDLSDFVFADACDFLKTHRDSCEIVSSFVSSNPKNNTQSEAVQHAYQEAKIIRSGVADIIGREHVHVVGTSKAEKLQMLASVAGESDCVFIDDREVYVREALALGIPALLMLRVSVAHTIQLPDDLEVITSFEGLTK